MTASPGYIPSGFTKQVSESGRSQLDPRHPEVTEDVQRYVNRAEPAVIEIDVGQGRGSPQRDIKENLAEHPDARQIIVRGHTAWLLPEGRYSGLTQVVWAYDDAFVRVIGKTVDEAIVVKVAQELQFSHTTLS